MDYIQLLGLFAAALTTGANFPQTYKIIKSKSTEDISSITYIMLLIGGLSWVSYGILRDDIPIIIANAISVLTCASILLLKHTNDKVLETVHDKLIDDKEENVNTADSDTKNA
jgi:MtN3 and saliva related transmembrane protein